MQSYAGQDRAGHGQFAIMHSPVFFPMLSGESRNALRSTLIGLKKVLVLNNFFLKFLNTNL